MQAETTDGVRTQSYQLSDLEDDADIEVMTEVQQKPETPAPLLEPNHSPREQKLAQIRTGTESEREADTHERSSSWSGYLKKKWSSMKDSPQKPEPTEPKKRDWSKEQEALAKLKNSAVSTWNQVGTRFNEGGVYLYEASRRTAYATAENLKKIRISKTPIEALCRYEATQKPCPRALLICCTAIASSGLSTEDIFKIDVPEELVDAVSAHFVKDNGAVMPPNGVTPEVLAAVIKRFLMDLEEPLLTYRLHDEWMNAGDYPQCAKQVLEKLPAASQNSMDILLDCLNRIVGNASINQMEADALAESLAPCLLWKRSGALPGRRSAPAQVGIAKLFSRSASASDRGDGDDQRSTDYASVGDSSAHDQSESAEKTGRVPLSPEECNNLIKALSHLITNYRPS